MTKLQKSLSKLKIDDICIITYKNPHVISLIVILHRIDFNHSSVEEYYFKVISCNPANAWKIGSNFVLVASLNYKEYYLKVEKIEDKQ